MRARFRRWVGIFGAVTVIAGTTSAAALAIGQEAASAAGTVSIALDPGGATGIFQNVLGLATSPGPINAGNGYTITVSNWSSGDQIILETGTPNGGPGVECNTALPAGVNQTTVDMSNFVFFSESDMDTGNIVVSGSDAPAVTVTPASDDYIPGIADDAPWPSDCGSNTGASGYNELVLTLSGTPELGGSATIYLGYSVSIDGVGPITQALAYDTGFGAATGAVPMAAYYCPATYTHAGANTNLSDCSDGHGAADEASPVTIPSDASVLGESPSANSPSSALHRQTGTETVAPTAISNFSITEIGGFLFPNNLYTGLAPDGLSADETVNPVTHTSGGTNEPDTGAVCLVVDNSTHQHLEFASTPAWNVSPGASTNPDTASVAGPATVTSSSPSDPNDIVQLPVNSDNALGTITTWTASGLTLETDPGDTTDSDGPVYAYVYWVSGTPTDNLCSGIYDSGDPYYISSGNQSPNSETQLGYVQLATVSELANAIYGATQVDTAAAAIAHQFNYADGSCIGSDLGNIGQKLIAGGSIFLATDGDYHDALGAAYPAGANDSAVMLTDPNTLSPAAASIIRDEGVSTVYLVGGPLAVSNAVENTLASTPAYTCGGTTPRYNLLGQVQDLTVIRIAGQTADDTNLQLATFPGLEKIYPVGAVGAYNTPTLFDDTGGSSTGAPATFGNAAIMVTDSSFQDAVSASGLAYYGPVPLITTTPGALDADALQALYDDNINQVLLIGGPDAVSNSVVSQLSSLGFAVLRIAGMDASETSTMLASFELANGISLVNGTLTSVGLGLDNNDYNWGAWVARTGGTIGVFNERISAHTVLLSRADYYADALSASVLSVHNARYDYNDERFNPMVLAENPGSLGTPVTSFLNDAGLPVSTLPGSAAAAGWRNSHYGRVSLGFDPGFYGDQYISGVKYYGTQNNDASSNVYTIQPVGGPLALSPATLAAAQAAVSALG